MEILHTIYSLSHDPRGLSTDPPPTLLVHVVIECPLTTFRVPSDYRAQKQKSSTNLSFIHYGGIGICLVYSIVKDSNADLTVGN